MQQRVITVHRSLGHLRTAVEKLPHHRPLLPMLTVWQGSFIRVPILITN
jgi:hypothetical protein